MVPVLSLAAMTRSKHLLALAGFCLLAIFLWMAPVLLAGFPYVVSPYIKQAHLSGLEHSINPLFTIVTGWRMNFIDWKDATGWAFVSAVTMALAMIPLWWSIKKISDVRIAWASIILFAFLPMHWREAIGTGYYPLAFFWLFLGFALYLTFEGRNRFLATGLLGACFGLVLATTHAFFPFLPWFVAVYLYERRAQWKKGVAELAACGICSYAAFVLPLLPNALKPDLTLTQRIGALVPVEDNLMQPAELYGDDYAYGFLKKEFDEKMAVQAASDSFFERRDNENFRLNYGILAGNPFRNIANGMWLLANAMGSLFMQETVGGLFLWLFLLPGILILARTNKKLLLRLLGLWLSMEIILRFGFHYSRIHLMDVGWIVAFIAGTGVIAVADAMQKALPSRKKHAIAAVILLVAALQLIQANRTIIAREYNRSGVPRAYAVAEALDALPSEAVVAQPYDDTLTVFTDRETVVLNDDTLDVLIEKNALADPFLHYGVTHIVGFDAPYAEAIRKAVPSVTVVGIKEGVGIPLTPFKRYLLNIIR